MKKIVATLLFLLWSVSVYAQTIDSITYTTDRGFTGTVDSPASTWSTNVPLLAGLNTITFAVLNSNGQTATVQQTILYTPTFPGNAMVAAHAFKDGSGSVSTDSSSNAHNGTLVNGATWTTQGKFDNAITFDGVNDYVNIPDANYLDFTQSFTISAWVKPTNLTGWRTIAAKGQTTNVLLFPVQFLYASNAGGSGCVAGRVQGGFIANGVLGPINNICSTAPLPTGQLSHVALTYDGSNLKLYINGALNNTVAATGLMEPSTLAWQIGNDSFWGGNNDAFAGDIDSVRLYNLALPIGALTPGAECTAADRAAQDNVATATVRGAMNCSILPSTPPLTIKFPASATGLKVESAAAGAKFGAVP